MTADQEHDARLLAWARKAGANGYARSVRERAGWSQGELAAAIDTTEASVSRWESGDRRPRGELGLAYARVLAELAAVTSRRTA